MQRGWSGRRESSGANCEPALEPDGFREGMKTMQDVFYIAAVILFFVVAALYVRGCDTL